MTDSRTDPIRHTPIDDAQGLAVGVLMCGFGLTLLTHVGLITGQTAGIAVILSYLTGWSFGTMFFLVNIPFYVLAYLHLGLSFTLKSLLSVTLLSVVADLLPLGLRFDHVDPALGSVLFGMLVGIGLVVMFRHNGSLGGLGVVALLIQDKTGFQAGYVQLIADALIFAVALFLFPWTIIAYSLLGAVVLNLIIAFNHRRDRYIAT